MKKLIMTLSLLSLVACGASDKNLESKNRLVYSGGNYYVYYDTSVLQIPKGTYLTNSENIDGYFFNFFGTHAKDEKKLELDLSRYFPHGIEAIQEKTVNPSDVIQVPTLKMGDKNIIDSIKLSEILAGDTEMSLINVDNTSEVVKIKDSAQVDPDVSLAGKTVEVLNANGINGFAKKLGESFKKNLQMNYIAENYKEKSNMSYVVNHNLSKQEFRKFVNSISLKYIKVINDEELGKDADVVLVTGKDTDINFQVLIASKNGKSELTSLLGDYKPDTVKASDSQKIDGITISFNQEDKVIAYRLLSYIPTAELKEDPSLKNKIIITTDR